MIRTRVFATKKVIYKLEIMLSYISFLILAILLVIIMIKQNIFKYELVFDKNFFEIKENFTNQKIAYNIIKRKIKIFYDNSDFSQTDEDIKISKSDYYTSLEIEEEISQEENTNILDTKIIPYQKLKKPTSYSVESLDGGKIKVGNIIIKNYTTKKIDLETLKKPSLVSITDKTNFLIFHTHTSETYQIDKSKYSDFYRTEDQEYNVVSVRKNFCKLA